MTGRPGRKPLPNREEVRTTHVTVKMSVVERDALIAMVEQRRMERAESGVDGVYTLSAYVRDLVAQEVQRRRGAKKRHGC
jgi:hypothetical protein